MTNDCKTCPVSTGTHKPAEAVHQIAEPAASVEKQIDEVMQLVLGWQIKSDIAGDAAIDAFDPECSVEDDAFANKCHEEQLEAWEAIRSKLRTLLSTPQPCSRSHPHEEMTPMCELRTEIARLTNALARAEAAAPQAVQAAVPGDVVSDLKNALADATELRQQLRLMEDHARGEVWRWQTDAENDLASMGNRMGVLIYAADLRNLLSAPAHPAEGVPAQAAKLPPLPEPTAFLVCKGSEVTARAWNVDQMRAYAAAALAATHPTQQGLDALAESVREAFAKTCDAAEAQAKETGESAKQKGDFASQLVAGGAASQAERLAIYFRGSEFAPALHAALAAQAKQGGASHG